MIKITTKKAAASIYVVVFSTIILSIIALSFLRIVLSEYAQSSHNDLSQSAYDSALAGTEDAKVALLKYHDCLNRGYTANLSKTDDRHECEDLIRNMEEMMNQESCDTVSAVLSRNIKADSGSVIIENVLKEDMSVKNSGTAEHLNQAYTCVKIKKDIKDYTSTLSYENRTRIIPLKIKNLNDMNSISFSWHSVERKDIKYQGGSDLKSNPSNDLEYAPPVLKLELFQSDEINKRPNFTIGQFFNKHDQPGRTNRGFIILKPVKSDNANLIKESDSVSFSNSNDHQENRFANVNCKEGNDRTYMCNVNIELPRPFMNKARSQSLTFLKVNLLYGTPSTEFNLKLCKGNNGTICGESDFGGIQAVVDATGKASDFYRRIESRIELIDTNFPYPEHAISTPSEKFEKNFYITNNCWVHNGSNSDNNGQCENYKTPLGPDEK